MEIGHMFESRDDALLFLECYSNNNNFNFKYVRNEDRMIKAICNINNCSFFINLLNDSKKKKFSFERPALFLKSNH